jgi:diguanylate cyclase (GGDEF)-like protein/PAS domain S-box-containing protein
MNSPRDHILFVLYEMALVIGGETSLKPLLTRTLQRLLYHTSFPAGFICLDLPASTGEPDEMQTVRMDAAVGDYELADLVEKQVHLPALLLHGDASRVAEDPLLLSRIPVSSGRYHAYLRLPIDGCGVIVLLAPQIPSSDLPLTQMFHPVMANLTKAIRLCRQHDALIAGREQAEKSLLQSEYHLRTLIESSPIGINFSRDGIIVDANSAHLLMFGFESIDELRGKPLLDRIAPQCREEIAERIKRRAEGLPVESVYETVGLHKDGTQFPMLVSATRVTMPDGPLTFAFLLDISRQKQDEKQIRQLAFFDPLTHLPNRRLLMDRLKKAMAIGMRSGRHGALILLDLDQFKTLNDTRGHSAGDRLLVEVAKRLQECVREGDSLARIGGDEFVVVLEELSTDPGEASLQAQQAAEKIRIQLGNPYPLDRNEYHITPSIGIAMFCGHQQSLEELFVHADTAMYQSKAGGRNTIRFFDPAMQAALETRSELEKALRGALSRNEFQLYYQPQVDHLSRLIGVEALLRWRHPDLGMVSPASFIPVAEETGLILPVGQWVLETASTQLARWQSHPQLKSLSIAVNVSARQFHQAAFVSQVEDVIKHYGISLGQLKLELTESLILENMEDGIEKMKLLKNAGAHFSMDDFGTGYSSLSYLKRLPLNQIKIDQSFVRDIATSSNDAAIVRTIIAMADSLGLDVIAEGVETSAQRDFLEQHGCLKYQGYLFGKPMLAEELERSILADELTPL